MSTLLDEELKKYGIAETDIKPEKKKLLSFDERWEILNNFFEKNQKKINCFRNKLERSFTLVFSSREDAIKFSKKPSEGLLTFCRSVIKDRGDDFTTFDIFFNLTVTYDESQKNKTPNVVVVRVL